MSYRKIFLGILFALPSLILWFDSGHVNAQLKPLYASGQANAQMKPLLASGQANAQVKPKFASGQANAQKTPLPDNKNSANYTLGYGDAIDVLVWKEPDFTLENSVIRLDGKITMPLVNDVQAAGRTTRELKGHLEIVLRKYVDNPVVTVILKEARSQRFYILGQVVQAGEYQLSKELTVLQAFAIAGGFTEWANKKEIFVLRRYAGGDTKISINYHDILSGKDLKGNIVLQADDTIMVP